MAFFHDRVTQDELTLYLGALFHYINEFYQRTIDENHNCLKHQGWSANIADEILQDNRLGTMVLNNDRPETLLQYLIAIGDKLSVGKRVSADAKQNSSPHNIPLTAILSQISLDGSKCKTAYKKLRPISTDAIEDLFPVTERVEALGQQDYLEHWQAFTNEFKGIIYQDPIHRLWVLTGLLEKYCSSMPTAVESTISLWLHAKLSTAIAFALYRQGLAMEKAEKIYSALKAKFWDSQEDILLGEAEICLLKADISGIQDFVYDTAMDGAIKALRGRSFYIAYLMDVMAKYILCSEKLPVTNILYSGGGHFYLLLPASAMDRLEAYREKCERVLFDAHEGKLAVLLDAVELRFSDFGDENFLQKWQEVGSRVQTEKGKKFWRLIRNRADRFFGPFTDYAEVCPHCGKQMKADQCAFCDDFIELGDSLVKALYLVEKKVVPTETECRSLQDVFRAFGIELQLTSTPNRDGRCFALKQSDLAWNDCCGLYLLAAHFPVQADRTLKTFEELAASSQGLQTWGVLRGDVDNLGKIFTEGLGSDRSISRVAALSADMSCYFSTILPRLIADSSYADRVGVVYAGGDDFFIVGSWDALPQIAEIINQKFQKYSAFNPSLTVSMAISLAPSYKYPLYRVALAAGEDLDDKAKSHSRPVQGRTKDKDALAFLNTAIGWEELGNLKSLQETICTALDKDAPHALLQILYKAWEEKETAAERNEIFKTWRIVYALSRLRQRVKLSKPEIAKVQNMVLISGNKLFPLTRQAARWAELLKRSTGGKENG